MSARSDALTLPRVGGIDRRIVRSAAWGLAVVAGAVLATAALSGGGAVRPAPRPADPSVRAVTGTGPGLMVMGLEWQLAAQPVPAVTGTGPDLEVAARISAARAEVAGSAARHLHRGPGSPAARSGGAARDPRTPAEIHARQLAW